jgi:MFS family permease
MSAHAAAAVTPDAPEGLPPGMPRRVAASLIAIPLVHGIGQSLLFAILPAVARDQGISDLRVGMVYMLPAIAWSLLTAWWGHRCDHWDRKPILLLSVLGFAASMLMFAGAAAAAYAGWIGATALWLLILLSRLVYSGLSSGALPAMQAYVIQRSQPAQRLTAISRITAAWNFGSLLGPGVIGILAAFGTLTPILAAGAFAVAVWAVVRRTREAQPPRARPSGHLPRLSPFDSRIRTVLLLGLCGSLSQAILFQTLGFYFIDGLQFSTQDTPRVVGIALMLSALATLFSQVILVPRLPVNARMLQHLGLWSSLLAFLVLSFSASLYATWLATTLCGLGFGLLRPGNIIEASQRVEAHEQGAVAGLNGALWSGGYILTPLFAMQLHAVNPHLPYGVACVVIAAGVLATFQRRATSMP